MSKKFWKVEYCLSQKTEQGDPFDEQCWKKFMEVRPLFTEMMKEVGFPEKVPSCTTQYGFCYIIEYIFDLYLDDCLGMEDDNHTIKALSPGGTAYEKLKKLCSEKNFYLNTRSSCYIP